MTEEDKKDLLQDLTKKMLPKLFMSVLSPKGKDITLTLDNLELKLPSFEHPIKLTGKIVLSFDHKKGKE